jgi:hypothetical protein
MGASPSTTQTSQQSQQSTTAPLLGGSQLSGILGQAPSASSLATTPYENMALQQLQQNATGANQYTSGLQGAAQNALSGGGYGQGNAGIASALQQSNANLTPYANGSNLSPQTNPAYNQLLTSLQTGVNNSVMDQFNAAGRSFSPAESQALATGYTNALAPYQFGQYNQNVQNQLGANQSLNTNALNASQGYNQSAGGVLGAQAQAPTAISNINTPAGLQLAAGSAPQQFQLGQLGSLSNLILPIAAGGGTSSTGTGSGTSTTTQNQNPFQLAAGLGIGGLGALGQSGAFGGTTGTAGTGGWLGSALGGLGGLFGL